MPGREAYGDLTRCSYTAHVHISSVSLSSFVDVNASHILITRSAKRQASSQDRTKAKGTGAAYDYGDPNPAGIWMFDVAMGVS